MPLKKPIKNVDKTSCIDLTTQFEQSQIEEIDAIAKLEGMSRPEVMQVALDFFVTNYKANTLSCDETKLEKQLKEIHKLFAKIIKLNAQVLYFSTLPFSHGTPKAKLNQKAFQALYLKSSKFAAEFLEPDDLSKD